MSLDSDNVRVAVTGAVYVGPLATAAPTSHASVLAGGFADLGYLSEDGFTEQPEKSSEDIRGWQRNAIIRTVLAEAVMKYSFTMVETNLATVELYYGTTVDDTDGEILLDPAATGGRKSFVFDTLDGDLSERRYIAEGEVTEVGERQFISTGVSGYPITITAYTVPICWIEALIAESA